MGCVCMVILFELVLIDIFAQQKFTLSGTITDEKNGEILIGANVYIASLKTGASSNEYGFFSLTLPKTDSLLIVFNYIG